MIHLRYLKHSTGYALEISLLGQLELEKWNYVGAGFEHENAARYLQFDTAHLCSTK